MNRLLTLKEHKTNFLSNFTHRREGARNHAFFNKHSAVESESKSHRSTSLLSTKHKQHSRTQKGLKKLFGFFSNDSKDSENKSGNMLKLLGLGTVGVCVSQLLLWRYEEKKKNATIVDLGWTASVGTLGTLYAIKGTGDKNTRLLVGLASSLWAIRLTSYLYMKRIRGKEDIEDSRYQTLRKKWGEHASRNFFIFFQAQALLSVLFSLPMLVTTHRSTPLSLSRGVLASFIALLAIGGEGLADYQLTQFKKNPNNKAKVCQDGLWNYSRHPNYFFEWLYWWTYVTLALGSKKWWITLTAPITLLYLLFNVTGIPVTEEQALSTKGDQYRKYQRTTSQFVPWFKKKKNGDQVKE